MKYINKIKLTLVKEKVEEYNTSLPEKIKNSAHAYPYFKHS
jgi:hypothetical protein